ncbi:AAA family ATPase [Saccharophagus degradans]|uniref:UvrD-helicase domain-containing protein n=1 Tax=Saccharophagus degradans TaxID=86304 RepID=UPI001C08F8F7|nr:UvrD-helicase domain-containing protein [Saccharophagus degradans]MBU2987345.1 AAA family ATPase [Saccharophagus degradans]
MDRKVDPFDKIKDCISKNRNFVLQGGAGSGKTEFLKRTLEYLSTEYPRMKIACITHTNMAVDEIKSRVGEGYTISTIHSFLNDIVKDYQKNLHACIYELFKLDLIEHGSLDDYENDEKEMKAGEHKKYKKKYRKYASTLYSVKGERAEKVSGKREYDKDPEGYNAQLNGMITALNNEIKKIIDDKEFDSVRYNNTSFNSFQDLSFGHDGLLDISSIIFSKYSTIAKIVQDKYDCIFIDEYQDTNEKVVDIFLNKLPDQERILIGLFGDSMQSIYSSGVGDVKRYIENKVLEKIDKEDNYRCSQQVVDFINRFRDDSLEQKVALKRLEDATFEALDERQGTVEIYYSFAPKRPKGRLSPEENKEYKAAYIKAVDELVSRALNGNKSYRLLKLTNKAIASDAGFGNLYEVFNARFSDNKEAIDNHLSSLQLIELCELCNAFSPCEASGLSPNYNLVISQLEKQKFKIKSIGDKTKVKGMFDSILSSDLSLIEAVQKAVEVKLLNVSEKYLGYLERRSSFLDGIAKDSEYMKFKELYKNGKNTLPRIRDDIPSLDQYEFDEFEKKVKKDTFFHDLFSKLIPFQEVLNYYNYSNEFTQHITMHKTKGSGIENVLVVLDEYFWNIEYNFRSIYSDDFDAVKKWKNQKLFYVACSRTIKNLKVVRLLSDADEEREFTSTFKNSINIALNS